MKARGNTKIILQKVNKVQQLVGEAKTLHQNDRDRSAYERAQQKLDEAEELCIEITGMYDPV